MSVLRLPTFLLLAAIALEFAACGDSASQQELQLVERCVRQSLQTWAGGESPEVLKTRPTPIEFYDDDWQAGASLIGFKITKTYHDTDGHARCTVNVSVRRSTGVSSEYEVTYQVNTEPKIVIARDPYS